MKRSLSVLLLTCLFIGALSGCRFSGASAAKLPFNGDIRFHDISAVIPSDYLRDSTQSDDDTWVFEKGSYSEVIVLHRSDADGDIDTGLDDYVQLMTERGAACARGSFRNADAVLSTYDRDGVYCQEILFVYNDSYYAFALQGGTEEEFQALLNDINTPDTIGGDAAAAAGNGAGDVV